MPPECRICNTSFTTNQEFGAHLNSKHLYGCQGCSTECIDKVARDQHYRQLHRQHPCAICCRTFPTEVALAIHCANPNNTELTRCEICNKTVEFNETLWDHVQDSHPLQCPILDGPYQCIQFPNKKDFDVHLLYCHHLYPCNTCHLVYRTEQQRADHVLVTHPVPCPMCRKVFVSEVERDSHIIDTHPGIRCSVCQQLFTTELQFNLHFNQQHVISCPHCPKHFCNDAEKTEHINTVHRCQCHICHEFMNNIETLRFHYNSLHRFKCTVCEEFLVDKEALRYHYDIEHRYTCFVCDRVFCREADRDSHATTVHQVRCDVCGIQLDSEYQKVDHHKAVHQVQCELCERRCISVHELQVHCVNMHGKVYGDDECTCVLQPISSLSLSTGEESKCNVCDETFPTEKMMVKHYKDNHAAQYKDNFQIAK